ncbi:MAG: DUF2865 domain-containing protein [Devosiaceae bacterium]|nr:DUF2865 domain-containing protein [Devosiaceae bacterium MH13]
MPQRQVVPGAGFPSRSDPHRGFDRPGDGFGDPQPRLRGNTFRTMCVRTTDGFYWPISFSTTRDRFDEDQGLCAAMCPGTPVELFAYRNPGEQVDAMVSTLTGESYLSQTYAFDYREDFDPANRCTPSSLMLQDLRSGSGTIASTAPARTVPQPSARPALESDPETRALAAAGIDFEALATIAQERRGGTELVRRVGPAYDYFTE